MPPAKIDPATLRNMIETQMLTQEDAAKRLGASKSCVGRTCARLGLTTQRTGPRSGALHPDWKGGRKMVGRYLYVWTGKEHPMATKAGYVSEHRLAMSRKIGRYLSPEEVVHHIDGNPLNNAIENLELFASNAEHLRHELTGRTPNHSPEGVERMRENGRRRRKHPLPKRDD
jgi:hypothetical protein